MSVEKVNEYFSRYNMENKIIHLDDSIATVALAANALGCEENRIAKTMSFETKEGPIVIVTAGDTKIDNRKYRDEFNQKAKMVHYEDVEKIIGHIPGGVCPFAVNDDVRVYLDISLKRFETVFPAAGDINNAIELAIPELEKYTNYEKWIDVSTIIV